MTFQTDSKRPDRMPSGMPMMMQTITATTMKPIVRAV